MGNIIENEVLIRIVIIDVSMPLGSEVYDEAILPVLQATNFIKKYIDITKYRIITI
jgi:hypothetical protein